MEASIPASFYPILGAAIAVAVLVAVVVLWAVERRKTHNSRNRDDR